MKDVRLMIATPAYGDITTDYSFSILDSLAFLYTKKLDVFVDFCENSSLVMDARNTLVDRFLDTDSTHLLFIDADISFTPEDILALLEHSDNDHLVVCGLYPKKKPNWLMISHIAKLGAPPEALEEQLGTLDNTLFTPLDPPQNSNVPIRVKSTGAGFMLIKREVFDQLRKTYPEYTYYEKNNYEEGYTEKYAYFDTRFIINEDGKRLHLGEDVSFCYLCRDMGIDIWVLPWVNLGHTGRMKFQSSVNYRKNQK